MMESVQETSSFLGQIMRSTVNINSMFYSMLQKHLVSSEMTNTLIRDFSVTQKQGTVDFSVS